MAPDVNDGYRYAQPIIQILEKMKDNRKGVWSIRVNDQWRVCFRFEDGHAFDVEIVDYH